MKMLVALLACALFMVAPLSGAELLKASKTPFSVVITGFMHSIIYNNIYYVSKDNKNIYLNNKDGYVAILTIGEIQSIIFTENYHEKK